MKRLFIGMLVVVSVWGVVLRVYEIADQSYWIDEAYSITIAQAIVDHGYPLLDSGAILWRGPVYHYMLAGMIFVFGDGPIATRSVSVIIGLITCVILALIARTWFSQRTAVVVFVLTNFSYWEIAWSRQARMYMLLQLLFWLAVFLFERWQNKKNHWVWFVLCTIATIATHQFGWLLVFTFILWWVIKKQRYTLILSYTGTIVITVITLSVVSYMVTHVGPVQYWTHYIRFLLSQHTVLLVSALGGLVLSIYRAQHRYGLWLAGIFLGCLGVLSYSVPLLQYRYLFFIIPALLLLAAYAIVSVHSAWQVSGGITLLILSSGFGFTLLPGNQYWLESDSPTSHFAYKSFTPQPDFSDAYTFIQQANPDILITPYPSISRMYREIDDTAALYVDLTGTIMNQPAQDIYTGVPNITLEQLKMFKESGQSGLIIIDGFAKRRMNSTIYDYIEINCQSVYSKADNPWSSITIYAF